jgi:outer membrane protein OmpA-like peptidoglycan-associated protein
MGMTMRIMLAAAIALAIPTLSAAQTAPQYSADQILKHFNSSDCPDGNCLPKANTRAVCIGTAADCANQAPPPVEAAGGFDLLITFEIGSDRLSSQAQANLAEFARAMSDPSLAAATFNVDGHTDARGSDAFNQTLSERRAESVVRYLESLGVDRARLQAKGHGEADLRNPADPFAEVNRRVEATIRTR